MERDVRSVEDVLRLLDGMFEAGADRWSDRGGGWWDAFYANRRREVPFFAAKPDENLAAYLDRGLVAPGRALDLGSGPGRNAVFLAGRGFDVEAVDLSATAVAWGEERAREAGVGVRFHCGDAFDRVRAEPHAVRADAGPVREEPGPARADADRAGPPRGGPYDLVYDSGCFHHLPPHRRVSYLALLRAHVAPGGHFGLACFAAGADGMGSELPDAELYGDGRLHGGLAYTAESLRWIFGALGWEEVELRRMRDEGAESAYFGEAFLWTALFRRPA
ncbi:class I SAM-dependent methyltransferase [Streptomyces sp. B22F1]|uniref:class I SAM-dependent methyltransferase n=1 Tax=Streptomyces sp. B22F1 TaxID=3153566 RepID=UPI00325E3B18